MEQRKLIKLGNSSFAIALPKEWVDKSGLKKGDNIFLERNSNGELIIVPSERKNKEEKSISISVNGKSESELKREIQTAYIEGYNSIHLTEKEGRSRNDYIQSIIKELIGLEISEESSHETILRDFFDLREANYKNFVRRMDNNTREIFEIIISGLKKSGLPKKNVRDIEEIDRDTNKIYFLNSRITFRGMDNPSIQSYLKSSPTRLFNNWWQAFHLESLGDLLKSIARKISEQRISEKQVQILLELLEILRRIYFDSMEGFYKNDKILAKKTINDTLQIRGKIEKVREQEGEELNEILFKIEMAVKNVYQNSKITLYTDKKND